MKQGKKLTRSEKSSKGGRGKGKSLYQRKRKFLAAENTRRSELHLPGAMGFDFPIGQKPWK